MGSRIELQNLLETIVPNVYFQPPPSDQMVYPCIVFKRSDIITAFAANLPYTTTKQYTLTVIDSDPDSAYPDQVALLPRCIFDRSFKADGLNHDVFTITF